MSKINGLRFSPSSQNSQRAPILSQRDNAIGRHFPAMTAVQVAGFVEEGAKVEIQAIAVVPD
jgi:enamine deaminase RidA (YjgF/YER057c/UK114 family)